MPASKEQPKDGRKPISKAQQKAVHKYVREHYDRQEVTMEKGKKAVVKAHAEARGESVNGFINRAITEQMERDNAVLHSEKTKNVSRYQ